MRRKQKLITILLSIFLLGTFAYAAREILFQQAKSLIMQNLEKNLPCKLAVGKIKAGLFYGLVLEGLEISSQGTGVDLHIKVEESRIDYNLWQSLFSQKPKEVRILRLIAPTISLVFFPQSENKQLNLSPARVKVSEAGRQGSGFDWGEFVLSLEEGRICLQDENRPLIKNLAGKIVFTEEGLCFRDIKGTLEDNSPDILRIYGELTQAYLSLTVNLEHLKLGNFDILTNLALELDRTLSSQDAGSRIRGTLKTYGSVLNNRPFPELNSSFEIKDDKLRILTLGLGDNYDLRGVLELSSPLRTDLSLNFYQAELNELFSRFSQPAPATFSGLVNGLIKITGELNQPQVEGYLEVKQGHIGDLRFLSADINIGGRYPKILLSNSRIFREEDSFSIAGEIDFTNLEGQNFVELEFKPEGGMLWQGWDISRRREDQVHFSKGIADDFKVTFDTFLEDGSAGYEDNYVNELALEYAILGDKLIKLRIKKEEGILGLEQRLKF